MRGRGCLPGLCSGLSVTGVAGVDLAGPGHEVIDNITSVQLQAVVARWQAGELHPAQARATTAR